jgi:hypothetical protein
LKKRLIIGMLLVTTALYSQTTKEIVVNNQTLIVEEEEYDEYGSKGKTISFYKDKNSKPLLSFVLEDTTGGCNDKSVERGAYDINGSTITLYSFWKRVGSVDDAPYGARVKQYKLTDSSKIEQLSSQLYIEEHTKDSNLDSGMKFLFINPKSKEEKKLFKKYIKRVEKLFKGEFVFEEKADKVMRDVLKALRKRVKARWQR